MCLLGTPITPDVAALRWGGSFRLDAVAGCLRTARQLCLDWVAGSTGRRTIGGGWATRASTLEAVGVTAPPAVLVSFAQARSGHRGVAHSRRHHVRTVVALGPCGR